MKIVNILKLAVVGMAVIIAIQLPIDTLFQERGYPTITKSLSYTLDETGKETHEIAQAIVDLHPGQLLVLHMNTRGGDVIELLELVNAMDTTKGKVKIVVDGVAFSAGAILLFHADYVEFRAKTFALVHLAGYTERYSVTTQYPELNVSITIPGSIRVIADNDPLVKMMNKQTADFMRPLIGDEGVKELYNGKDFVYTGEEFGKFLCAQYKICPN